MSKVMIIDDDVYIGNMLKEALSNEGYDGVQAYSGTEALLLLEKEEPDVILLDLMLPGLSGEELLPKIKNIPVIVVSAKIGIDDKVDLLLGGAADYITKPFEIRELMARIKVQLRNRRGNTINDILTVGDISLDAGTHEVSVAGNMVKLTKTEHAILKLLMLNEGNAISKSVILERISEDTPDCTDSSLKQHISNLRKKLREVSEKEYIEAVWGIGFRFVG
ncbi:MAG: response regulator transcription factor [Lachnospiraceae bacterium]|nr:response regulator transcription factor [Lachnospiraceae bacterium]